MKCYLKILLALTLLFTLPGCLEDVIEVNEVRFSNSADLISYTEARTEFFNSQNRPQLISVEELNQNLGTYLVLDIRDEFEFKAGHVPEAKNIEMKELLNYFKEINSSLYQKIVLVSSTGQLASYSSSLLFVGGYENIYTLDGGMTYWNEVFSNELRNAMGNDVRYIRIHEASPSSSTANPPDLFYESNPKTIEDKIEERIQFLLSEPIENIFISAKEFDSRYSIKLHGYTNTVVIYAQQERNLPTLRSGQTRVIKGPISSLFFDMPFYFTSNKFLLSLSTQKEIVVYSDAGQQSGFIIAYLRLLGYSAKTIKYGKVSMMCLTIRELHEDRNNPIVVTGYDTLYCIDINQKVKDYPYVVGE